MRWFGSVLEQDKYTSETKEFVECVADGLLQYKTMDFRDASNTTYGLECVAASASSDSLTEKILNYMSAGMQLQDEDVINVNLPALYKYSHDLVFRYLEKFDASQEDWIALTTGATSLP